MPYKSFQAIFLHICTYSYIYKLEKDTKTGRKMIHNLIAEGKVDSIVKYGVTIDKEHTNHAIGQVCVTCISISNKRLAVMILESNEFYKIYKSLPVFDY